MATVAPTPRVSETNTPSVTAGVFRSERPEYRRSAQNRSIDENIPEVWQSARFVGKGFQVEA